MDNPLRLLSSGGSTLTTGGNGLSVSPFIDESGQSIGLKCFDANGNPTNIVNLSLSAGVQPVIYKNGTAISGAQWTYGITNPCNEATAWLPQSSPASKIYGFGDGNFKQGGYGWVFNSAAPGSSGNAQSTATTGDSISLVADGFLPGTYSLAITWIPDATLATSVPVTVQTITNGAADAPLTIDLNMSVAPNDFTFNGVGWKILDLPTIAWPTTGFQVDITNPGGKIAFDALQVARTSPDISVTFAPTDVATMDLSYAWADTSAGPIVGPSGGPAPPVFADADFSSPSSAATAYFGDYNPTGTPWTFSGAAPATNAGNGGLTTDTSNGSGIAPINITNIGIAGSYQGYNGLPGNPDNPPSSSTGAMVAFTQGTSSFSQSLTFAAGTYSVYFLMSPRVFDPGGVVISVLVDGAVVGSFATPNGAGFVSYHTLPFTVTAGSHVVEFSQVNPSPPTSTSSSTEGLSTTFFSSPTIAVTNSLTGIPVTNNVGVPSVGVPNLNQVTTLKPGYNVQADSAYYGPAFLYSSLAGRVQFYLTGANTATFDSLGYPTLSTQSSFSGIPVAWPSTAYPNATRFGMNSTPNGYWTVEWDGLDICGLSDLGDQSGTENTSYRITGQTTGNRQVVNIQAHLNQAYGPLVGVSVSPANTTPNSSGQYTYDISNLRIYPPDPSDPTGMTPWLTGQPKWYPAPQTWLKGAGILRIMDWMGTNNCNSGTYADLRLPGAMAGPVRSLSATIATISNVSGTPFFAQSHYCSFQIGFTAPHPFFEKAPAHLNLANPLDFTNGATIASNFAPINGFVHVIDATTIEYLLLYPSEAAGAQLTAPVTGGSVTLDTGTPGPWLDFIDLCTLIKADLHCNIPISLEDAAITQMAVDCAARLTPGRKIYLEYENEHWNNAGPFVSWYWFTNRSLSLYNTNGPTPAYVAEAAHAFDVFIPAFVAAGGNASDVIRVLGTQGTNPGVTSEIVAACTSQGVTFDHLVGANYVGNSGISGPEGAFTKVMDGLTNEQTLDYNAYNLRNGKFQNFTLNHRSVLDAAGFTNVTIGFYEGGYSQITPGNTFVNGYERTYEAINHPRMFGQQFYFNQLMQDVAKATTWAIYYLTGGGQVNNSGNRYQAIPQTWPTYYGYNQANGTGDPTIDTANLNTPLAFDVTKSQVGGGVALFNLLRSGPVVSSTSSVTAQQRAIGRKPNRHHGI